MLPLTLTLEEFNGREKIAYPRVRSTTAGFDGFVANTVNNASLHNGPAGSV